MMSVLSRRTVAVAFELFEPGVEIMRQNLRRRHPADTPDEHLERLSGRDHLGLDTGGGEEQIHDDPAGPASRGWRQTHGGQPSRRFVLDSVIC